MPLIPIEEVRVRRRVRKELKNIESLARSIATLGLLNPLTVDEDHCLIAGRRRLEAMRLLKWPQVPVHVSRSAKDAVHYLLIEQDENTEREPFTPSEAVEIARAIEERGGFTSGRVRDALGKAVGLSGRTLAKAREVTTAAKADPALRPLVERMDRTGKVDGAYRELKRLRGQRTPRSELLTELNRLAKRVRRVATVDASEVDRWLDEGKRILAGR